MCVFISFILGGSLHTFRYEVAPAGSHTGVFLFIFTHLLCLCCFCLSELFDARRVQPSVDLVGLSRMCVLRNDSAAYSGVSATWCEKHGSMNGLENLHIHKDCDEATMISDEKRDGQTAFVPSRRLIHLQREDLSNPDCN